MWTSKSKNSYHLVGLDTNAVSEIVKHSELEGKNFITRFRPSDHAPCFSIVTIAELYKKPPVYQKFLDVFSNYHACFVLKGEDQLFEEEREAYANNTPIVGLFNAFSPLGKDDSYDLRKIMSALFNDPKTQQFMASWDQTSEYIIQGMLSLKPNFNASQAYTNPKDARRFVKIVGKQQLKERIGNQYGIQMKRYDSPNIDHFPSLKNQLFLTYYYLYDDNRKPKRSDVGDIRISASLPYIDIFITEGFSAEKLRQIQKHHNFLENLKVMTLKKDLRN